MYQTDDDIVELLLIPKVGRARARTLFNAGFKTLEDLAHAKPEELARIPGISPGIAAGIIESAGGMLRSKPAADRLEAESRIDICPMCGSMVSAGSKVCNGCGITFSDEVEDLTQNLDAKDGNVEDDGFWYRDQGKLFICPECGSLVADGSRSCPNCSVRFEEGEEDVTDQPAPAPGDADGFWYKSGSKISMCPNCGSFLSGDAKDCSSCGLAFETDEDEDLEPENIICPMCKKDVPHGTDKCAGCGFDFSAGKDKDGFWYKEQGGLFMCPSCGAFIPRDADRCSICGSALEEGEEEEETPQPQAVLCPMCGIPALAGAGKCAGCGFDFSTEKDKDGFWYKDSVALFICPMCGAFMSEAADRCANCGAAFDDGDELKEAATGIAPDMSAQIAVEKEAADLIELVEIEEELDAAVKNDLAALEGLSVAEDGGVSVPDSLVLCPVCGAFSKSGETKCPACSAVFDDIEDMELGAVGAISPGGISNAELAREMAAEIREIEDELLEPVKGAKPDKKGVSKDFLDRWKRLDGNGTPTLHAKKGDSEMPADTEMLDEAELEASIDELVGKPKPGGFWIRRARELAAGGQVEEAVACLDRAAETDPDRELEYKRLMLELMGVGLAEDKVDLSEIAAIDEIGELNIDNDVLSGTIENRLREIDRELDREPGNSALWQEKGELLEKLGRHEEAVRCFDTSISMTYANLRKEAKDSHRRVPQIGIGLTNGQGRVNGRINGLLIQRGLSRGETNGLTNGRVNGMRMSRGKINGMINGLAGRVNGLTNGKINGTGLVNGRTNGRTNGRMNGAGMINGSRVGLINGGLVNGLGLVNGETMTGGSGALRRLRQRRRERIMWRYRLTAMALFVTLVLMLSMLGNLMVEEESGVISIDGNFADWEDVQTYSNFLGAPVSSDLRILETGVMFEGDSLKVRVDFEGQPFNAAAGSVDSVWLFVDLDGNPGTGYIMEGRGMDLMAEIYGWNGTVMGTNLHRFDNAQNRSDWSGFSGIGSVPCAVGGPSLEASVRVPRDMVQLMREPSILVMTLDSEGNSDATDYFMSDAGGGNVATFRHSGADVIVPGTVVTLGELTLSAHSANGAEFLGLEFTITGGIAPDLADIVLRDAGGAELMTRLSVSGNAVSLEFVQPMILMRDAAATISVEANIPQAAGGTLGLTLDGANATGGARTRNLNARLHNLGMPGAISVDGAFGDWAYTSANPDRTGDVISGGGDPGYLNSNIDIADARLAGDVDVLFFYASVHGIMMGGSDIPLIRSRPGEPGPIPEVDSDRDSVPDALDPYYLDFNNDGIPDSESLTPENAADLDGDGQVDYPNGPDWWLNTTVPADVVAPYGGSEVSVFIGPVDVAHQESLGDDRAYIMFDADSDSGTGGNLRGAPGVEYAVVVSGKQNRIMASELYVNDPAHLPTGWRFLRNISAATDWNRLEGSVQYSALGLNPSDNFTAYVAFEDWTGGNDISDDPLQYQDTGFPVTGTRSPAGDNVVINEVSAFGSAEWVELCNPTGAGINIGGWTLRLQNGASGNYNTFYTFPAGTTIGAFGSGNEYRVVALNNQLTDANKGLRLYSGNNIIDQASYTTPTTGTTFARFKNATFGMPTDTDGAGDWYISTAPTNGAPNDRRAPSIAVTKTGDKTVAAPGDQVTYAIWYNNTGDGNARHVWVNDTLPTGMSYVSSSVPYSSFTGQVYRWYFTQVAPGTHLFTTTVQVGVAVPTGTVLTNNVQVQYTDQLSRFMGTSSDSYDVTVLAPQPDITLSKTADLPAPFPNEIVTFTINYDNVGSGTAGHVWLNDTLPTGLSYVSGAPTPGQVIGQNVLWHFLNVDIGSHSVTLQARVGATVTPGTVLTNTVTCDYKNLAGISLPRETAQRDVTVGNPTTGVVINEIVNRPNPEWFELCNPSTQAINIGGWRLQYQQGNWRTVYTFPAGTTIGVWGSGAEYLLVANLPAGSLPDQNQLVRLWSGSSAIDSTTYTNVGPGQSWSRFKHEDTGKPIDTGSAADWYLSNNAWLVPEGPTPGAPNDRKRPIMNVEKTTMPATAEPGQLITYMIWYNNTGDGNAKNIWINDTLPTGVDCVSASPAPTSISGQNLVWFFSNVVHDTTNFITLTVRMNELPNDGDVLTNIVDMIYHDALKRPIGTSTDSAVVTCARPVISVEKTANVAETVAGGTIVYTIYYNNTGSRTAAHVWINDTLPAGVTFVSASISPTVSGSTLNWHLTNVAPGTHSITVTVTVNATTVSGTITNWAFLDYASGYGFGLGTSSDSATVIIPEMQRLAVPVLGIMLIVIVTVRKGRRQNGKEI